MPGAHAVKLQVLTAAGGEPWETDLVAALDAGDLGIGVARRCVDVLELLSVAAAGQGRAALVAASLRHLDADVIDRLLAAEVAPVGVVSRGDAAAEERLRALGVTHLVPDDAEAAVVASVLVEAARAGGAPAVTARTARMFGDPSVSTAIPPGGAIPPGAVVPPGAVAAPGAAVPPPTLPTRRGSVLAVWGPTGAPGRTTVAVSLADELARLGSAAMLVDADVYGGSVAAVLGLLDDCPGLAGACRQASATRLDPAALAALCWQLSPSLRVLTGVPLASRWPELRPAAVETVLALTRSMSEFAVVDCGFSLETDEELSFDSIAPRRNGATLAVLESADVIIAVGAADPIGMQRLVRGLADLRELDLAAPVRVVLNKVRSGAVPGDVKAELTGALQRFAGCLPAALLPFDHVSLDVAVASGRSLAEARASSPLRRAVGEFAAELAGVPVRPARRRVRGHRG